MFTREDISSLPIPDAKFQVAKTDYSGQLIVTPKMVPKKIKAIKEHKSPEVRLLMESVEKIVYQ